MWLDRLNPLLFTSHFPGCTRHSWPYATTSSALQTIFIAAFPILLLDARKKTTVPVVPYSTYVYIFALEWILHLLCPAIGRKLLFGHRWHVLAYNRRYSISTVCVFNNIPLRLLFTIVNESFHPSVTKDIVFPYRHVQKFVWEGALIERAPLPIPLQHGHLKHLWSVFVRYVLVPLRRQRTFPSHYLRAFSPHRTAMYQEHCTRRLPFKAISAMKSQQTFDKTIHHYQMSCHSLYALLRYMLTLLCPSPPVQEHYILYISD